jgi:hypothetical protein
MDEKLILIPLTLADANSFVATFHRHSKPTVGHKFSIGAATNGLVGVAIVGRPIARLLDDGWTAEVLRTCCSPDAPKNTNSFLYGACWRAWRAMGGRKIITYTLQDESGSSLRGAGWKAIAQVKPHGGWNREKLGRLREFDAISQQAKIRWEMLATQEVTPCPA